MNPWILTALAQAILLLVFRAAGMPPLETVLLAIGIACTLPLAVTRTWSPAS